MLGDLTTDALLCLSMRDGAGVVVVDVNYRHCPGKLSALRGRVYEMERRTLTRRIKRQLGARV